jgi:hypothetical protein
MDAIYILRIFVDIESAFSAFSKHLYKYPKTVINDKKKNFKTVLIEIRYSAWHKITNSVYCSFLKIL